MAVLDVGWLTIGPNGSGSWFNHGYTAQDSVHYSIVVFGVGGFPAPLGKATLTQGEAYEHVDGTKAYKVYVQNNAPSNSVNVHILAQVESL
ncbi:hypothetical protein ACFV4T_19205 [Streptomyces sp. NPDC059755]|uniref:hypothetical protein n=1 Tax=Streptomyces sp. NPDC059755 TaxID=3346934 RepID=UPI00364AB7A7